MLTYSEEILLLALDERTGTLQPLPAQALRYALAGALLVELAMRNRIDTDLHRLYVADSAPTGDPLLDGILAELSAADRPEHSTGDWLNTLAWRTPELQTQVLKRLIDKGLLRLEERRMFWVFRERRYVLTDGRDLKDIRVRLRELIDSDEIPDPHDAVLIGLLEACQLFEMLFAPDELKRLRPRIENLARLDLIAREVGQAIREISRAMAAAMPGIL